MTEELNKTSTFILFLVKSYLNHVFLGLNKFFVKKMMSVPYECKVKL